MFYIYFLYSINAGKYYTGCTSDVQNRLVQHNNAIQNSYTSKYRPWELKASFPVSNNKFEALKIEKFIKNQKSKVFIEKLIDKSDDLDYIQSLIRNVLAK
jgi:putative endonuclease